MPWWGSSKPKVLEATEFHIIDDLKILKAELGSGSYGTVYCAVYNGKPCVVKEMHPFSKVVYKDGPTPLDMCIKEINTLSSLRHPSIVQFLGVYFKNNSHVPIIVMERMWKNLSTILEERPNQLPLLIKTHILYDVACGLQYLHGQDIPVIHRDLNANNVLLAENLDAKIADLGQAKAFLNISAERLSTRPGNIAHMPPEALKHNPMYDAKLDIFSFGCTVIHLVTETFPEPAQQFVQSTDDQSSFLKLSEVERRKELINQMTSSKHYTFQQLAIQCLQDESIKRPTASYLCSQLDKHIKVLEAELPELAKQCKEDKLYLIQLVQSQGDSLENATKEFQKEMKSLESQIWSLRKELEKQKDLTSMSESQVSRLKEEIEAKQNEIGVKVQEMEQEILNLNNDLKSDMARLSEKDYTIASLEANLEKTTDSLDAYKQQNKTLVADKEDLCNKNKDLAWQLAELQKKYKVLQVTSKKQQDEILYFQKGKILANSESHLHQMILEVQHVNEIEHQQLQEQRQSYVDTINHKETMVDDLRVKLSTIKKKCATQKQQLEEKSYRLSMLESSLNELQESLYSKEEKLKLTEETNTLLTQLLANNDNLYRKLQKECEDKDASLKRKEIEVHMQRKEHADEKSNLKSQHSREVQCLIKDYNMHISQAAKQEEASELIKERIQCELDLTKNGDQQLQNELKDAIEIQEDLKRQIKHHERTIKEKIKCIEKSKYFGYFNFNIHWSPYLSLPAKRIRPSAVIVKDKVYITGGYQQVCPLGRELDSCLKPLERGNEVFSFHTTKCRCDSIASPVVLGGITSVNGQCVLVSGAEGNTLTGNVYVLCEEESDEQWKKFSEPVPTPRILPCVCCYGERWMILCGGYAYKEGSNILEALNVMEILDTTKGEWYQLSEEQCPNVSNVICCAVVGQDVYVIGDKKVISSNSNKLITASTRTGNRNAPLWSETDIKKKLNEDFYPFSVVEVNGELMIVASISGSKDDGTCVLMKDTTDTWRKMSEAVECQHCSAVVVTPTLELLLFGGSENVIGDEATHICQQGISILNLDILNQPIQYTAYPNGQSTFYAQENALEENQPPAVSFTGPIHTKQFDHKGGIYQSPVHNVSIVVPPNAIDDGEKVTIHMGATPSGPFDLPEDCKLRSAVVWLGSGSDVMLKRSITVVVPHSAVFTSPQHHSMMRFLVCEDCEGPRYKFRYSMDHFEIDNDQGCIELQRFSMLAVAAGSITREIKSAEFYYAPGDDASCNSKSYTGMSYGIPSGRYVAKLFWPRGHLPNSFRVDVFYLQNLPTEHYKVDTLYRKNYCEDNGLYPEIVETEFLISGNGTELKCVLPCSGSSECDCLSGWSVTQMSDISEIHIEKDKRSYLQYKTDPVKCSFKFTCYQPKAYLTCCFAFPGGERIVKSSSDQVPSCLLSRYHITHNSIPFIVEKGVFDEATNKKDDK